MLVGASRPDRRDVFLDPFGGRGSLVLARLELPVRQILYSDTDLESCRRYFPGELTKDVRVRFLSENALTLPSVPDRRIDVIVTDPPWGEYREIGQSYGAFALGIARAFDRVLHPIRGRFVVLASRSTAAGIAARLAEASFRMNKGYEILVNGHPATVLVGGRYGGPDAGARGASGPAAMAT
jgi:tRNA G10  N-methylase Trm11